MNAKQYGPTSLPSRSEVPPSPPANAPAGPQSQAGTGATWQAIDAYVELQRRRLAIPGVSLAIVEGGRVVHLRGFGRARPGGAAPKPETPFYIGSLTKSFTALAVMQLVEAGQVELDAPVQRYLPWFRVADPVASAQVTVRQLLVQTSGLPNAAGELILADFDASPGAAERQARALASVRLAHPPGAAWEYSNANYQLLGLVIEATCGETYAEYVQQHLLLPLGLSHTSAAPRGGALAVGHQMWFGLPVAAPAMHMPGGALAGGGLVSSAADLARYLAALLNGGRLGEAQIVSGGSLEMMHRGAVEVRWRGVSLGQYGMGWFVDKLGTSKLVWHSGTLPHFGAFMALLPEQQTGIVLLFNACHHWFNPVLTEFGLGAAARLAGEQPAALPVVGLIPWLLRGLVLVPVLPAAEVAATLWQLGRRQRAPGRRPKVARFGRRHSLLPLIPNLLAALTLIPLLGKRRDYLKLYMPDFSLVARLCGGLALAWGVARTVLVLRTFGGRANPGTHETLASQPKSGRRGNRI